ncbi:MAG: class II fructose-bisphosphate aldolase [bacterium]|nr:class II fructose-bisphosphate aldolase [bacterium]
MSRGLGLDELNHARREGRGILGAVAYDTVGVEAIVTAGRRSGRPIIAQIGSSAFNHVDAGGLIAAARMIIERSPTPVGLHLDHSRSLDEIRRCLDAGYTSVMVDGSHLDFAENVALSSGAVDLAGSYDAWVEAELGRIEGDEDRSTAVAGPGGLTHPDYAARFVGATGVDALAVSVGNVHGRTRTPAQIQLDLLAELREAVDVPLVLHGVSGIDGDILAAACRLGVAKFNVNADLRAAYLGAVTEWARKPPGDDLVGALRLARQRMTEVLTDLIAVLDPP